MRLTPWLALAAALPPLSCSFFGVDSAPNLLVVTVDGLRFDAISRSLGAARTPNLHALAQDGVSFTHCYSHSPVGLPAHVALFSARPPQSTGVTSNGMAIDREVTLLAEWLKRRGYATAAAVSMATLWTPPPEPAEEGAPRASRKEAPTGLERGFDAYAMGPRELIPAEEVNRRLLAQLDSSPRSQPWFLFAQYSEPREPYDAWGSVSTEAELLLDGQPLATVPTSDSQDLVQSFELAPGLHQLVVRSKVEIEVRRMTCVSEQAAIGLRWGQGKLRTPARELVLLLENPGTQNASCQLEAWIHDVPDLTQTRARYKLEVEAVDRALGSLVAELRRRDIYDDTVIVFTADHGTALGEHGRVGAGQGLYDELLRVPLIFKPLRGWEGRNKLAKLEHNAMRQIDIVPTALALLDERTLPGAEGESVLKCADRTLYAEVHPPEALDSSFCVRDERYKLLFTAGSSRFEMYEVTSDTLEADDVYELQGHFRAAWQSELRRFAANSAQAVNVRMGMAERRPAPLKALGY